MNEVQIIYSVNEIVEGIRAGKGVAIPLSLGATLWVCPYSLFEIGCKDWLLSCDKGGAKRCTGFGDITIFSLAKNAFPLRIAEDVVEIMNRVRETTERAIAAQIDA